MEKKMIRDGEKLRCQELNHSWISDALLILGFFISFLGIIFLI